MDKLQMNDLKELNQKRPFIYEISQKYYLIGNWTSIYLMESPIIGIYQEYLKENNNDRKKLFITILKYCIKYSKEYRIVFIKEYCKRFSIEYTPKEDGNVLMLVKEYESFLNILNDEERKSLLEQANKFVATYSEFHSDINCELEEIL